MSPSDPPHEIPGAQSGEGAKAEDHGLIPPSLEQRASECGPFQPPADFDHGEEFAAHIPRPIPVFLRKGSFARGQRRVAFFIAALGTSFLIFAPWDLVHRLSFYVIPLGYLGPAGYALIVVAILRAIRDRLSLQRFEYVTAGTPIIGRVLSVEPWVIRSQHENTIPVADYFQFQVTVEYDDPETRKHEFATIVNDEVWKYSQFSEYAVDLHPGDYVTLVGLPAQFRETLKLYGFLGLDPKREFLLYRGHPLASTSSLNAILISKLVVPGLCLIAGLQLLMTFCFPLEWRLPITLLSMCIGIVCGAVFGWCIGRLEQHCGQPQSSPPTLAVVCGFLGILAGAMGMGSVNAVFDRSVPTYRAVTIDGHWRTIHGLFLCSYEIEYTEFGKNKSERTHVSVENQLRLGAEKLAAMEIRQGSLDLKWVAGFHPLVWVPLPDNAALPDKDRAVSIDRQKWQQAALKRLELGNGLEEIPPFAARAGQTIKLLPVLVLPDGSYAVPPDELMQPALQQLRQETE